MGVHLFNANGVDVSIERTAFRERVSYDHQRVSEISLVIPRLVYTHAFTAAEPATRFEVRTYEPGGWIMWREGQVISSQRPGWAYVVIFGMFAVAQWVDFAGDRTTADAVIAAFSTTALGLMLTIHLLWSRAVRATRTAVGSAVPAAND